MSVYIDSYNAKFGRMIMCHMMADSLEELYEMVDKIGVNRKWIQKIGTPQYDRLLEEFIENFDASLYGLMLKLISLDKEFWYA